MKRNKELVRHWKDRKEKKVSHNVLKYPAVLKTFNSTFLVTLFIKTKLQVMVVLARQ